MSYQKLSSIGTPISKENYEILVPEIKTAEEKKNMLNSFKICVIDVNAEWCGPCKITAPLFAKLYKNYNLAGVIGLAKEDVDLHLSPNVQVIPTFQFYVNGQFDSIITGADMNSVEQKIIELIKNMENLSPEQKINS